MTAQEDLTKTYEGSINNGVGKFNEETRVLAENPMIKEISLIIAQEIQRKSSADPNMSNTIGGQSQAHFA
jgi:hypothetical protein